MPLERTFAMIKPNAIKKQLMGPILTHYEQKGLKVVAARLAKLSQQQAEDFYAEHKERPFFKGLISIITSAPVLLLVLEAKNAVAFHRDVIGATDPAKAAPGTIRKLFGESIDSNAVHGSDSLASAAREMAFFFQNDQILEY